MAVLLPPSAPLLKGGKTTDGSVKPTSLDAEKRFSSQRRDWMFLWGHTKLLAKYVPGGRWQSKLPATY
jgi:hypothetical protein